MCLVWSEYYVNEKVENLIEAKKKPSNLNKFASPQSNIGLEKNNFWEIGVGLISTFHKCWRENAVFAVRAFGGESWQGALKKEQKLRSPSQCVAFNSAGNRYIFEPVVLLSLALSVVALSFIEHASQFFTRFCCPGYWWWPFVGLISPIVPGHSTCMPKADRLHRPVCTCGTSTPSPTHPPRLVFNTQAGMGGGIAHPNYSVTKINAFWFN